MTITGYYWDGINSYVIYQDKKGNTTIKRRVNDLER
jgi:hypothetical protein